MARSLPTLCPGNQCAVTAYETGHLQGAATSLSPLGGAGLREEVRSGRSCPRLEKGCNRLGTREVMHRLFPGLWRLAGSVSAVGTASTWEDCGDDREQRTNTPSISTFPSHIMAFGGLSVCKVKSPGPLLLSASSGCEQTPLHF